MLDREMWDMFLFFTSKAKWITSNWTVYFAFERGLVFAEKQRDRCSLRQLEYCSDVFQKYRFTRKAFDFSEG